jgi:mono/diheme cytochrome c family protein
MASVVLPARADPRVAATQAAVGLPAGPALAAQAQAQARGQALYEARCGGCHDRSVHQRSARTAADFAAVRAAVVRWDRELGALWRGEEVDAVTRYLNERFYRFPCSGPACAGPQASRGTSGR